MKDMMTTYRWNVSVAAETFDASAQVIHPFYVEIQGEILSLLGANEYAGGTREPNCVVDLGGGSGRLLERVLDRFANSRAVLVDQSGAFLAIAERKLARFGDRVTFVEKRLQDDWAAELTIAPDALVSMSAIHHLEPREKQSLYQTCYGALAPNGLFLNGDEVRPESDAEYLAAMKWWCDQKDIAIAAGQIPASFQANLMAWRERNVGRFGEPKVSGDDCHETGAVQEEYLRAAGFREVRMPWNKQLWGILYGRK
jgi:tRNA (cmo5U34)-methyltransferase